jgi:hypothetical protein
MRVAHKRECRSLLVDRKHTNNRLMAEQQMPAEWQCVFNQSALLQAVSDVLLRPRPQVRQPTVAARQAAKAARKAARTAMERVAAGSTSNIERI